MLNIFKNIKYILLISALIIIAGCNPLGSTNESSIDPNFQPGANGSTNPTPTPTPTSGGSAPSDPSSLTLITPATSPSNNTTPIVRIGGVTSGDTVTLYSDASCTTSIGSATASAATVDITSSALSDGTYTFAAKSLNGVGSSNCSTATVSYTLDTIAPTIAITTPSTNSYINSSTDSTTFSVNGTCSENGRTVTIKVDGTSVTTTGGACNGTNFTSTIDSTALSAGAHAFTAYITDSAGNATTSSSITVTRDVTAPTTPNSLVLLTSSPNQSATPSIRVATTANGNSVSIYTNSSCAVVSLKGTATASGATTDITSSSLSPDGTYTFYADSTDPAGNTSACSAASVNYVLDTTAPTAIAISSPANNSYISASSDSTTFAFSGTCSENGSQVTVKVDGSAVTTTNVTTCNGTNWAVTIDSTSISSGSHSFTAYYTDTAGNSKTSSAITLIRDVSSPTSLAITSPTTNSYINSTSDSATFAISGTCSENGSQVTVKVDGSAVTTTNVTTCNGTTWAVTIDSTTLSQAAHTFSAIYSDSAGNSTTSAGITVTRDVTAPTSIAITSPSTGTTIYSSTDSSTYALSGTCSENGSQVTVKVDGSAVTTTNVTTCNGTSWAVTINSTVLTEASHTFVATYSDAAGNTTNSAGITVSRDVTAPTIAITTPSTNSYINSSTDSTTFSVNGTCSENGRTVTIKVDGSSVTTTGGACDGTNFTSTIDSTALSAGAHAFTAYITDAAGNATTSSSITVTRDVTAPTIAITTPSTNSYINSSTDSTTFSVNGTCSENGRTVTIKVDGSSVTTTGGACDGTNFTSTIDSTALSAGAHAFTAYITDAAGNATTSASITVTRDVTAPTIAITTPSTNSYINSSTDSTTFSVNGTCSENGRTVTIKVDGSSVTTTGGACNGTNFTSTIDSTALSAGAHAFTAYIIDAAGNATTSSSITVTRDVTAPTSLAITSPTTGTYISSSTTSATYAISGTCSENGSQVTIKIGGVAVTTTNVTTCDGTNWAVTINTTALSEGALSVTAYYTDTAGNSKTSAAITLNKDTVINTLTSSNIATPGVSSASASTHSATQSPTITGVSDEPGSTVKIYEGSSCTTQYGSDATVAGDGTFSVSGTLSASYTSSDGTKSFSYTITDPQGNALACTSTGLSYYYQAKPIYTINRSYYSYKESNGDYIGTNLTIHRDEAGITDTVTLTPYAVSARATTNYANSNITVNFATTDTDVSISSSNPFGIVNDSTADGDKYFTVKMSLTSAGATNSTTISQAQINILDDDVTSGNYFFGHSFYSVSDSSSTVTITVQRLTTGSAETVTVSFTDGTATGASSGADYNNTTQSLNFGVNESEKDITIDIGNVSSNKSFYARINTSASIHSRAQGVAKIRILDSSESNTCDATNTNTGVNSGYGGGTGADSAHPWLICNAFQLDRIRNNMTGKYFKLMADIDALGDSTNSNTAITPINGTASPNALASTTTYFSGYVDGNERTVSNFTYTGNGTSDKDEGFIRIAGDSSNNRAYFKNFNLIYASMTNIGQNSGLLFGQNGTSYKNPPYTSNTSSYPLTIDSVYVSGYLNSATTYSGLMAGFESMETAGVSIYVSNTLVTGTLSVSGSTGTAGGVIGGIVNQLNGAASPDLVLNKIYTGVTIYGSTTENNLGSLIGSMSGYRQVAGNGDTISNVYARGIVTGGASVGGIIGYEYTKGPSVTFSSVYSDVYVTGTNYIGGFIGELALYGGTSSTVSISGTNSGTITIASGTGVGIAGLVGDVFYNSDGPDLTFSNSYNYGTISNAGTGQGTGGILGNLRQMASTGANTVTVTFSSNTNYGAVSSSGSRVGGIAGSLVYGGANLGITTSINGNSNSGTISGVGYVGGINGYLGVFNSGGTSSLAMGSTSANTNSGSITGSGNNIGGINGVFACGGSYTSCAMSNATNTGNVSATATNANYVGGINGIVYPIPGLAVTFTSLYSNTGTITATANGAGGASIAYIGGLIGGINSGTYAGGSINITSSKSTSPISVMSTSNPAGVGGIIGGFFNNNLASSNDLIIDKSWASGDISGNSSVGVGGLVGVYRCTGAAANSSKLTMTKSYYYSTGSGITAATSVGGLIGLVQTAGGCTGSSTATDVYAYGAVSGGTQYVGGILGYGNTIAGATMTFDYMYAATCISGAGNNKGTVFGYNATGTSYTANGFWRLDGGGAGTCNNGFTQSTTSAATNATPAVSDSRNKTATELQALDLNTTFDANWAGSASNSPYPILLNMP